MHFRENTLILALYLKFGSPWFSWSIRRLWGGSKDQKAEGLTQPYLHTQSWWFSSQVTDSKRIYHRVVEPKALVNAEGLPSLLPQSSHGLSSFQALRCLCWPPSSQTGCTCDPRSPTRSTQLGDWVPHQLWLWPKLFWSPCLHIGWE